MKKIIFVSLVLCSIVASAQKSLTTFGVEIGYPNGGLNNLNGYVRGGGFPGYANAWFDFIGRSKKNKPSAGIKIKLFYEYLPMTDNGNPEKFVKIGETGGA